MKKFLTISMMALAVVFASSCNKDEDEPETNTNYVNTWVDADVAASDVLSYVDVAELPETVKQFLATQTANLKFTAVASLAADGRGNAGILVEKTKLNLIVTAVETYLNQHASEISEATLAKIQAVMTQLKPVLDSLNDNDYVGTPFTYTVAPTDATSGKFTFTTELKGKEETAEVSYSNLSETTMTITGMIGTEDGTEAKATDSAKSYTLHLKSAASAKVTVGNFVDATTLAASIEK